MLRTEKVRVDDRELEVKEISFAGQMRLEKLEKITTEDLYRESMKKEDFDYLENVGKEQSKLIRDAMANVNGWKTQIKDTDSGDELKKK